LLFNLNLEVGSGSSSAGQPETFIIKFSCQKNLLTPPPPPPPPSSYGLSLKEKEEEEEEEGSVLSLPAGT